MIECIVIGYGNWGKKITNVLLETKNINIQSICKRNIKNLKKPSKFKGKIFKDYKIAINKKIDAVFISTPAKTHYEIAKYSLQNGKNVFVEKPVCFKNNEFNELNKLAKKKFTSFACRLYSYI